MRILTITNFYPPDVYGGYELGCGQAVEALTARGHEVRVLAARPRWPVPPQPGVQRTLRLTEWQFAAAGAREGSPWRGLMSAQGNLFDSPNVSALLDCLAEFRPDVVYLWNVTFVGALGIVGALAHLQLPVVWHLMDDVPRSAVSVDGVVSVAVGRAVSRRLRIRFLACSQRVLDEAMAAGFDVDGRAELVPNWVHPMADQRPRSHYPASGTGLRVVAAGQLAPHKGIDVVIGAAQLLLDAGFAGFSVDLYGSGEVEHYTRLIAERGLGDCVRLRGMVPQARLADLLWDYDLFLLPTWKREPFGFAPLEAAARGCVPMISDDCGNAEWCVHGADCLKVTPTSRRVATAIASVLEQRVELAAIGRRARAAVRLQFNLGRVADRIESALSAVQELPLAATGTADDAYYLVRLGERLALDWAERFV